jgi:hypothetical protein
MKAEDSTVQAAKVARYTIGIGCFLVIVTCGYMAWNSWATLRLKSHGIPTTATVVQKAERQRQTLTSSVQLTFVTLSYWDGEALREVEVELPRGLGNELELGQKVQIFYDKSQPLRVLHPWEFVIVEQLSRDIIGIVSFGSLWLIVTVLTRGCKVRQLHAR